MFDNVGGKIKDLTRWVCLIAMAAFVILGLVQMFTDSFFGGLLTAVVGAAGAWTGSFVLYGFGELVESAMVLRDAELMRQTQQRNAQPVAGRRSRAQEQGGYSLSRVAAQQESKSTGTWVCKKCGRKNLDSSPLCWDCGSSRKDSVPAKQTGGYSLSQMAQQRESGATGGWTCKKCGKVNTPTAMFCSDCGNNR